MRCGSHSWPKSRSEPEHPAGNYWYEALRQELGLHSPGSFLVELFDEGRDLNTVQHRIDLGVLVENLAVFAEDERPGAARTGRAES